MLPTGYPAAAPCRPTGCPRRNLRRHRHQAPLLAAPRGSWLIGLIGLIGLIRQPQPKSPVLPTGCPRRYLRRHRHQAPLPAAPRGSWLIGLIGLIGLIRQSQPMAPVLPTGCQRRNLRKRRHQTASLAAPRGSWLIGLIRQSQPKSPVLPTGAHAVICFWGSPEGCAPPPLVTAATSPSLLGSGTLPPDKSDPPLVAAKGPRTACFAPKKNGRDNLPRPFFCLVT